MINDKCRRVWNGHHRRSDRVLKSAQSLHTIQALRLTEKSTSEYKYLQKLPLSRADHLSIFTMKEDLKVELIASQKEETYE